MLKQFIHFSVLAIVIVALLSLIWEGFLYLYVIILPIILLGLFDIFQKRHTILRNFPVLGHFRYMLELIRPEMYQYFIESDTSGRPIDREDRSVIYQRAKGVLDTLPFGTRRNVYEEHYEWINHSLKAHFPKHHDPRIMVGNHQCKQTYHASILNISAMSFGALSPEAVMAMNWGAKIGNFLQDTGEGGLSPHHLKYGGDLTWEIGTGYFSCRTPEGDFSPEQFREKATLPSVKMIEIKLSQGAKPGHGGILPAAKVSKEIARIRGVPEGKDVISPPTHTAFKTPIGLLEFIVKLRELCGGKPVGFKLCLGDRKEFMAICKAMLETKIYPDFITIDGGEGGTGAAPLEFSNSVGTPLDDGLVFVHNCLVGIGVRDHVRVICSGGLYTAFQMVAKIAMGANMCNTARAMMLATGCVMSLKCNTNRCPTGVTTQNPWLRYGCVVEEKYKRVASYHAETMKTFMEIIGAAGLDDPSELKPHHIFRRVSQTKVKAYDQIYYYLKPGQLLSNTIPVSYRKYWEEAKANEF